MPALIPWLMMLALPPIDRTPVKVPPLSLVKFTVFWPVTAVCTKLPVKMPLLVALMLPVAVTLPVRP